MNPIHTLYFTIKDRARRKKLSFTLKIVEFVDFCIRYKVEPGITEIDRISSGKGYELSNIQILSKSMNVAKGNRERHGQYQLY
jgi:hypothetical protein